MFIYAGIDEAGYGPMFGPLTVGRCVFAISSNQTNANHDAASQASPFNDDAVLSPTPDMWQLLSKAVCKNRSDTKGRVAVNDSKKLHTSKAKSGLKHLERGVLSFMGLAEHRPTCVGTYLDALGEASHRQLSALPWYQPDADQPWQPLPTSCTDGEIAVARSLLGVAAREAGVQMLDTSVAVVFEDRFNQMISATRSKAATSFTFVGRHIHDIWQKFGHQHPTIAVDRQSGRMRYRDLLATTVPGSKLTILQESPACSAYRLDAMGNNKRRSMTVQFQVDADATHLPVALASMISKYSRELLMARFQKWFAQRAPHVKPTAGYAKDGKRFWMEINPTLSELAIDPARLRRIS